MKILIHSNGPHVPSGYGTQCAYLVKQLKALGHDVAVSCLYGLAGQPIRWDGITLYPAGRADFSADVIGGHAASHEADVVITLMDNRMLNSIAPMLKQEPWHLISWVPVDTEDRLGSGDQRFLQMSGAMPVGMSKHGTELIKKAGFWGATCIPHSVDLDTFAPPVDRQRLREDAEVSDRFVIGLNAANMDSVRKAFPEQLEAFARFHKRHSDAMLMLHTQMVTSKGHNLYQMIDDFGLSDCVKITDQYVHTAGLMNAHRMADWYGACDILTLCSYAEGFGIPLLEAQACGVPVVTTDASATRELCGSGWLIGGEPFWNHVHHASWVRPSIAEITDAYEQAYEATPGLYTRLSQKARSFALGYDTEIIGNTHWGPLLNLLTDRAAALDYFEQAAANRPLPGIYEDDPAEGAQ